MRSHFESQSPSRGQTNQNSDPARGDGKSKKFVTVFSYHCCFLACLLRNCAHTYAAKTGVSIARACAMRCVSRERYAAANTAGGLCPPSFVCTCIGEIAKDVDLFGWFHSAQRPQQQICCVKRSSTHSQVYEDSIERGRRAPVPHGRIVLCKGSICEYGHRRRHCRETASTSKRPGHTLIFARAEQGLCRTREGSAAQCHPLSTRTSITAIFDEALRRGR